MENVILHAEPENLLYGLVLAGGESRRMGQDKAALLYQGRSQLERAMDLLVPLTQKTFVSVRNKVTEGLRANYPQIEDQKNIACTGPASGLLAAYKAWPDVSWLVLACDLPLMERNVLEALKQVWQEEADQWDAFSYKSSFDGQAEPLCAIWTPVMLGHLENLITEGKFCPRLALKQGRTRLLPPVATGALDNINTQEERQDVLRRLGSF